MRVKAPETILVTTPATTPASSRTSPPLAEPALRDRSAGPASGAVELTLHPCGLEEFLQAHWDSEPLLIPRADEGRFDGVLSREDLERLVCENGIRMPAFRLVKDGKPLSRADYTEDISWSPGGFTGTARVREVASEFAGGATLVLQGLNLHWRPAALYCRELEKAMGCPVQANAYLTPASAQGFSVHHDVHDVFVLQVSGTKRWRWYEPVLELPLQSQRWSQGFGDPGEPVADEVLRPGDTLYLPRGWPHEAFTSDSDSLHLTIGLHPPRRLDALKDALDRAAAEDVELRRALGSSGELPGDLLERVASRLGADEVRAAARRRFVSTRRPVLSGQLQSARAAERIGIDDRFERRNTVIFECEETARGVSLRFEGRELSFPSQAREAMLDICSRDRAFTPHELTGTLDEAGRLVLVRRLVREGFLEPSAA